MDQPLAAGMMPQTGRYRRLKLFYACTTQYKVQQYRDPQLRHAHAICNLGLDRVRVGSCGVVVV